MDGALDNEKSQSEAVAEAIFEAIADPIFVIDFVGDDLAANFSYVNGAACQLLRRTRDELRTMRPGTVDELPESVMDEAYQRLVTEGRATFETLMIDSDGCRIPMEIHASDAFLSGKRVCIAVARSLVARKEIDRKMLEAKEAAEAANRAKSEFLATMSHEIRTPLHGVVGFASLLDGGEDSERLSEAIDGIRDSANLLLALVTDVLDFSRIEAGQLELLPGSLDIAAQLKRIASAFKLRAKEKGLIFFYVESHPLPALVRADSLRIEQVLGNLLSNALKFTNQGSITLEVKVVSQAISGEHQILFIVSDTGIGIASDQLSRLFNPFSQVDASPTRRHGGSGLGLVIVKRLCELMGGTTNVQSSLGKGSVFTASIVAEVLSESDTDNSTAQDRPTDAAMQPLRILVADDNALNRKLMARMVERLGCSTYFASDGRETVEMVQAEVYDLIFMDVSMPEVSGLDATRTIRSFEKMVGRSPSWIVALTAGVSEDERKACSDAGMDDFLGKPFTEDGLSLAVKRGQFRRAQK